jgi:hypothetical protein
MKDFDPKKLKFDRLYFVLVLIAFILIAFYAVINKEIILIFAGVVYLPYLGVYFKTKNRTILLYNIFFYLYAAFEVFILNWENRELYHGSFLCFIFVLYAFFPNMSSKLPRNFFGRYLRKILRAAANKVNDARDGYTGRPYAAGKVNSSKAMFEKFAHYLNQYMIATAYYEEERVILVLSNGLFQYILFLNPSLEKVTYISYTKNDDIAVHIARKDYDKYKNELTFDQLCNSLVNMFIDIYHRYESGERDTIIEYFKETLKNESKTMKKIWAKFDRLYTVKE